MINKKNLSAFILCFLIIVILSTGINAGTNIYLGNIAAKEVVNKKFIIKVPFVDRPDTTYSVWFNKDLADKDNNILTSRLSLITAGGIITPGGNNKCIILESDDLIKYNNEKAVLLNFRAYPYDYPGEYSNILFLKNNKTGKTDELNLSVTLRPWVRFKVKARDKLLIKYSGYSSKSIVSSGTHILQIAANTDWFLYTSLNCKHNYGKNKKLRIIFPEIINKKVNFNTEWGQSCFIGSNERLMAEGRKTVNRDEYWLNIPFTLAVDDFTRIEAGNISYPLVFSIRQNTK